MAQGSRLPAEARRRQIVEAAARLVLDQGFLPLPPERLAEATGVSKALIYGYFPDQHALFNALMARQFAALEAEGLDAVSRDPSFETAAMGCAELYFRHVCAHGPVIHVVLRDLYMARRLDPKVAAVRDRVIRRLARHVRRDLHLPPDETVAAITLVTTIPEDAGRLVWQGDLSPEGGLELCRRLTAAALAALRPD
ncbi:TetR/AcrR family transcriptional regulator [Phenylobacterium aquaticum]|uniref:TetR/AcrR family transcriptional regulator n=1 Tax=Phenylobacterium aquaticum TaxID=1763816 RepID=UPI0026F0C5A7|nr:TetR/AcrR family transcriptional regulator [Phenylobacterium aquaticum]